MLSMTLRVIFFAFLRAQGCKDKELGKEEDQS